MGGAGWLGGLTPSCNASPLAGHIVGVERRLRFELLYAKHAPSVKAYVLRRADASTADDVVAEVFVVCWRRFEEIPVDPLPWLLGVARRVLSTQRRGERRRVALHDRLAQTAGHSVARAPAELAGAAPGGLNGEEPGGLNDEEPGGLADAIPRPGDGALAGVADAALAGALARLEGRRSRAAVADRLGGPIPGGGRERARHQACDRPCAPAARPAASDPGALARATRSHHLFIPIDGGTLMTLTR